VTAHCQSVANTKHWKELRTIYIYIYHCKYYNYSGIYYNNKETMTIIKQMAT